MQRYCAIVMPDYVEPFYKRKTSVGKITVYKKALSWTIAVCVRAKARDEDGLFNPAMNDGVNLILSSHPTSTKIHDRIKCAEKVNPVMHGGVNLI
jgi:hypothetical protein